MKTAIFSVLLLTATGSVAAASPLKLKCVVFDRHCDDQGRVVGDKYEMSAVMEKGVNVVQANVVTKNGRFTVKGMGIVDFRGPKNPKAVIQVYDSQTRVGAAAGSAGVGVPATPRADIVFVYGIDSIEDSENLFCHSIEGTCEFK